MTQPVKKKTAEHLRKHQFKKGQSGNPNGARAVDPVLRKARSMTQAELGEVMTTLLENDLQALQHMANAKTGVSVLKVWAATIATDAIKKRLTGPFEVLLNRTVGPVTQKIQLSKENPFDGMGPDQIEDEIKKLEDLKKAAPSDDKE